MTFFCLLLTSDYTLFDSIHNGNTKYGQMRLINIIRNLIVHLLALNVNDLIHLEENANNNNNKNFIYLPTYILLYKILE